MILKDLKKYNLPDSAGVYFFKKNAEILYIGKATSLKDRLRSYFANDLISARGSRIVDMVTMANKIDFKICDSVLEAIILESNLIKKFSPKYNIKEKDDRSYNYLVITKENFPRVLMIRGRELKNKTGLVKDLKISKTFGPFPNASQLKEVLKLVKKIFPHFDTKDVVTRENFFKKNKSKLNFQINLYPDIFNNKVSRQEYLSNIKNIRWLFSGKKQNILKSLEKEMKIQSKNLNFEKAGEIKKTIFALNHIRDVSLIKEENEIFENETNQKLSKVDENQKTPIIKNRLESYDIAHMAGTNTVGVMTVFENGQFQKNDYRKFIIKNSPKNDDYASLAEILERRLKHPEWPISEIVIIDGGRGQLNVARNIFKKFLLPEIYKQIKIVSVVKDDKHKAREILGFEKFLIEKKMAEKIKKEILLLNEETHRFAIQFHRQKRNVLK